MMRNTHTERPIICNDLVASETAPAGALEVFCDAALIPGFLLCYLMGDILGREVTFDHRLSRAYLVWWQSGTDLRSLRVSKGYDLSVRLKSYREGLAHEFPNVQSECAHVIDNLRIANGLLFEVDVDDIARNRVKLDLIDKVLRDDGRSLDVLPIVFLLSELPTATRLSDESLREALQAPICAHVRCNPKKRSGYVEALDLLARMIVQRQSEGKP